MIVNKPNSPHKLIKVEKVYRMFHCCLLALLWISCTIDTGVAEECGEFTDLGLHHSIVGTSLDIQLLLYTRANFTCARVLSHLSPFSQPELNASRPTAFIIHGYRPTGSPPGWYEQLAHLLLERDDLNVIVVDWNRGAATLNYFAAVKNTQKVADNMTAFILKMQEHGSPLSAFHLIGVSLGAHVSGFVGANLNGSIGRITALDPAGPEFTGKPADKRLDPTDAQFVDALHTDMDALGFRKQLGHIDFYPNGGGDQPGCPRHIFAGSAYFKCDHQRSVYLFMNSINRTCDMIAYPCESYTDFLDGKCMGCDKFQGEGCPVLGYDVIKWKDTLVKLRQTKTFSSTNNWSPFCKTSYKVDIVTWNHETRWGFLTLKLHSKDQETVAKIDHKAAEFIFYTEKTLLAQFDRDLQPVERVTLSFSTGNALKPRYKLRVLRIRLTPLHSSNRPLCRHDLLLEENKEVTFRPIPCEDSNF
ncbi:lipase member H isoform X2 [Clupea harengus]|uniref:Lipase member H isoform X2 n=1 Tax=Clupea harengus TaxID=7950 RepID=A0A6P3VK77_CLUHA|nr:lipase member H isoform X2 [Clupea harengus]